jgi:hypothetical protein
MNKIENQIKYIVQNEIDGNIAITNWHGVDLVKCLVEPYPATFEMSFRDSETVELYVVLEESQNSEKSYQIAYNPVEKLFGLCLLTQGENRLLLGYYDTFLDALEGM